MDASALASLSIAAECPACSLAPLKIAVDEAVVAKVLGCADTLELVLFHCALADLCAACCVSSAFRDAAVAAAGLLLARTPPGRSSLTAVLRAPPPCRVTGAATCFHGLCRDPRRQRAGNGPGVAHVLEALAAKALVAGDVRAHVDEAPGDVHARAHECLAELAEHDGAGAAARTHWEVAAAAGSAWSQLQLGLLQHREHGCEGEARENLLAAAFNGRADGWTEATAHLYLGFLHLDDKLSPCPEAAVMHFRECVRVSRGCPEAEEVAKEANDAMHKVNRFMYFANGMP